MDAFRIAPRVTAGPALVLVAAAGLLLLSLPAPALEAQPDTITFEGHGAEVFVRLTDAGEPLPQSAIEGWSLLVNDHTYDHMLDVTPKDGGVAVQPTDALEIGSYELVIETDRGSAAVTVYSPLRDLESSLERRAQRLGITVAQLKERMGIGQQVLSEEVTLEVDIPPVYYLGQTLSLPARTGDGQSYVWKINGERIPPADDGRTVAYTFTEPGIYTVSYGLKEAGDSVAAGYTATEAITEPPVSMTAGVGQPVIFTAPQGYTDYEWRVGGEAAATGDAFRHAFESPGTYTVTMRASSPETGAPQAMRVITYRITVGAK